MNNDHSAAQGELSHAQLINLLASYGFDESALKIQEFAFPSNPPDGSNRFALRGQADSGATIVIFEQIKGSVHIGPAKNGSPTEAHVGRPPYRELDNAVEIDITPNSCARFLSNANFSAIKGTP